MAAVVAPDVEECYLLALMDGADGIDLAEWSWVDEEQDDGCFRCWDVQWSWYTCPDVLQIDQAARSLGKSVGIQMRAYAFPFNHPGAEMLITAPELNHLRPLSDAIEMRLLGTRMSAEMLPRTKGRGIARQPHWQARFVNSSRITTRLPNRDGKGVKGQHPLLLEGDEMQDYPLAGWIELIETLKRGSIGAQWRCHGVSRGVRDKYYELTQEDSDFTVHRVLAMHRPSWTSQERAEKIKTYGGSRQNPDYKRNIYGEHGDASNPLFVLSRLMGCVDQDEGSQYNTDVYANISIDFERLSQSKTHPDDRLAIRNLIELPGTHLSGHELAPKGYSAYYGGMDIGVTNHPSEILVFGARAGRSVEHLDLLTRIHLERIDTDDQEEVVKHLFAFYGAKFKAFGLDKTGVGFTASQRLSKDPLVGARVHGYNFSEKVIVGFAERELAPGETQEDLAVWRNVVEHASDVLRIHYVDPRKLTLPFDRELLTEWQGQNYAIVKSAGSPYGRRDYSRGKFHTLDAGKMAAAARTLPLLAEMATYVAPRPPVLDIFVGA